MYINAVKMMGGVSCCESMVLLDFKSETKNLQVRIRLRYFCRTNQKQLLAVSSCNKTKHVVIVPECQK